MNALDMARTAYTSTSSPIRTERGTEFEAVARVTRDLRQAILQRPVNFPSLVGALHRNRQLWTIIAANVADGENALPADLRARLFYLAEFVQQHTRQVTARKAEANVLVEINVALMHGLRAGHGAKPEAVPQ